jgi:hypothetical protein
MIRRDDKTDNVADRQLRTPNADQICARPPPTAIFPRRESAPNLDRARPVKTTPSNGTPRVRSVAHEHIFDRNDPIVGDRNADEIRGAVGKIVNATIEVQPIPN